MPLPLGIPITMAAIGAGSQIFGGIASGKARKEAGGMVDTQIGDLTSWYDTEKNKDFLASNVAQSAMNKVMENIREQNRVAKSTAAITGASDASVVAQKGKGQEQYSDVIRDLASYGTARQDRLGEEYRTRLSSLLGQKTSLALGRAQEGAKLGKMGGDLISAGAGLFGETKFGIPSASQSAPLTNRFGRTPEMESRLRSLTN